MRLRVIGYLTVICFLTPKIKALKFFIFINWRHNKLELKLDVKAAPDNKGRVFLASFIPLFTLFANIRRVGLATA